MVHHGVRHAMAIFNCNVKKSLFAWVTQPWPDIANPEKNEREELVNTSATFENIISHRLCLPFLCSSVPFFSLFNFGKEKLHTDGTGEKLMTRNKQIENTERTHPFCEVNQVMRTNLYVCVGVCCAWYCL